MPVLKVEQYMSEVVIAAPSTANLSVVRNLMLKHGISRTLILEGEKLAGIVTKKDIARALASQASPWRRRPIDQISVKRVMSGKLVTIAPDAAIESAAKLMYEKGISSLPVVQKEKVVGIITKTDITRCFAENYAKKFKTSQLMRREVATVNRFHTLSHLITIMGENDGRVIVVHGKKPIGIITPTDVLFAYLSDTARGIKTKKLTYVRKPERASRPKYRYVKTVPMLTAEDLMSTELITIKKSEDAAKAAKLMLQNGISSLPVVEEDELVGAITKTDITRGVLHAG